MRGLLFIVTLYGAVLVPSAGAQSGTDNPDEMKFSQARKVITQVMAEYSPVVESDRTTVRFAGETCVIQYNATQFSLTRSSFGMHKASVLAKGTRCPSYNWYQLTLCFENQVDRCEQLHKAFIQLQQRQKRLSVRDSEELDAAFAKVATNYRGTDPKPVFPAEARRFRVQAEASVRDKEFEDASDFYAAALRIAPWWPEGRFNRALILGEIKEYAEAIQEMKRYLLLLPDAPNARAAQDRIYEWEGKAGGKR